jgi:HEPN domain-containing protein
MDSQEKFDHWVNIANNDLEAAELLHNGGLWLIAAFHCQQAIEKIVKGLYIIYKDDNFPFKHDIKEILLKFETYLPVTIPEHVYDFVDELSAYYIKARYASYKYELSIKMNKEKLHVFYQ